MNREILMSFLCSAITFGVWQGSIPAGCFMLCVLNSLQVIGEKLTEYRA